MTFGKKTLGKKLNTWVGKTVQVDSFIESISGVLVSYEKGTITLHTTGISGYGEGHDVFMKIDLIGNIRLI